MPAQSVLETLLTVSFAGFILSLIRLPADLVRALVLQAGDQIDLRRDDGPAAATGR